MGRIGRPMKYKHMILRLDPEQIYSSGSIARVADAEGWFDEEESKDLQRQRLRVTLNRLVENRSFPKMGDGRVTLKGQAAKPGWFGWRWQNAVEA